MCKKKKTSINFNVTVTNFVYFLLKAKILRYLTVFLTFCLLFYVVVIRLLISFVFY